MVTIYSREKYRRKKMRNQGQLTIAVVIILIGAIFLIGNLLDVDVWVFCWPIGLILLGLWLLFRPQLVGSDAAVGQKLLGNIRRKGVWQVTDEEFWLGIGDVRLDMTEAEIPIGETRIDVWHFVGDVRLVVPEGVGVKLSSSAFFVDARLFNRKVDSILTHVEMTSEDYETAERKIRLGTSSFVGEIRVRRQVSF
jgi:predicted membrane protein